jgi:proteasome lid subunit RPN8/RPN11
MSLNFHDAYEAAKAHARAEYPRESCGLIVKGVYVPCENRAADPKHHVDETDCACQLCRFVIDPQMLVKHRGEIDVVVHSHPNGPVFPSTADAASQIASGLTWALIALDEERISAPLVWGGTTPIAPIIGREFMHYTADCYTLIHDVFALGREALAAQDVDWPLDPIDLPLYPRDDAWWTGKDDFYNVEPFKIGFREVAASEARPGDVFLMSIRSDKMNHGGVLLGGGLILHHLPNRLSRREPAGIWGRQVSRWIRYEGTSDA